MSLNTVYDTPFDSEVQLIVYFSYEWKEKSLRLKCNILKFKWKNETYKVKEQISSWETREGNNPRINYTVRTNKSNKVFQLQYDLLSLKWTLIKIH